METICLGTLCSTNSQQSASVTIKSIAGIDHAVVAVKDLDAAAANWKQLGFTISPRGTHSAHMGTGNYTIMLGEDYMELLGVLDATEHNAPTRALSGTDRRRHRARRLHDAECGGGRSGNPHDGLCRDRPDRFRAAGDDAGRDARLRRNSQPSSGR